MSRGLDQSNARAENVQKSWQGRLLLAKNSVELNEKARRYPVDSSHNIVGNSSECVKRIEEYADLGVSLFMLVFPEATRDTGGMELFMERVAPSFSLGETQFRRYILSRKNSCALT